MWQVMKDVLSPRTIVHGWISIRVAYRFGAWLIDMGYKDEGAMILIAIKSYAAKEAERLKKVELDLRQKTLHR